MAKITSTVKNSRKQPTVTLGSRPAGAQSAAQHRDSTAMATRKALATKKKTASSAPARRRSDPKRQIREAAEELWSEKGFHATGVEELCQAVGMGRGALYYHIVSKEDLLREISLLYLGALIEDGRLIVAAHKSATRRLYLLSANLMRNIADNKNGWTVFFAEVRSLQGERRIEVLKQRAIYENLWTQLLAEGRANGEFKITSPLVVKGILGMHNYAYLWLNPRGRISPESIGKVFVDTITKGIARG